MVIFHQVDSSFVLPDIIRSDIALDKQKGCRLASHPDIMLELQREKAASTQLVLLKEQLSNIYSNITLTGRTFHTHKHRTRSTAWRPLGHVCVCTDAHVCERGLTHVNESHWE